MYTMIEGLAQTRHAERYSAAAGAARRGDLIGALQAARTRTGWLLVGLGLRLVLPRTTGASPGLRH